MMNLMTKELQSKIPALYSQEQINDPVVHAHFFCPANGWDWYVTEYDPKERICFGLVCGFEEELGYFPLEEMEATGKVERDLYWQPKSLSQCKGKT